MRRTVTVMLAALAACTVLSFPASASTIISDFDYDSLPYGHEGLESFLSETIVNHAEIASFIQDGYSYYALFGIDSREYLRIYLSKSSVVQEGDPVIHFYYRYYYDQWRLYQGSEQYIFAGLDASNGIARLNFIREDQSMISPMNLIYFEEFSTASLAGTYELTGVNPWIVGQARVDTSGLESLIAQAKGMNQTGYTTDSWQKLQTALTSGENLLASGDYTQDEVDAAAQTLRNALNSLILLDTSELEELVRQARAIVDDGYTTVSWQRLQSAISSAQSLLDSGTGTQLQYSTAATNLRNAMNALEYPPVIPPPVDEGRYLVDGIRVQDIMPAGDAMLEAVNFARGNGRLLFGLLVSIWLIPRALRAFFGLYREEHYVDMNEPSAKSRHYKGTKLPEVHSENETKYIDY